MPDFENIELSKNHINAIAEWLDDKSNVFSFSSDDHSSLLICYILKCQIGGPNDDLARFIVDIDKKQKIDRNHLRAEIGMAEGSIGPSVKITCQRSSRLSVTIPVLNDVMMCRDNEIIISPVAIAAYIRSQHLEPIIVKEWVRQVVFSDFNVRTESLANQLWVLRNNDALLYSKLVANQQVVFQGMHDIVGHIAGLQHAGFLFASEIATIACNKLHDYFRGMARGNLPSHLIPFLVGILLDELTQQPFYFSDSRVQAIHGLLDSLAESGIDPLDLLILKGFPVQLNEVMEMARQQDGFSLAVFRTKIRELYQECSSLIECQHMPRHSAA